MYRPGRRRTFTGRRVEVLRQKHLPGRTEAERTAGGARVGASKRYLGLEGACVLGSN